MSSHTPVESDPLEGTRYRTVGMLGEGSMGRVLAAEHRMMKKPVAVKILRAEYVGNEAFVDRFVLEAQVLAQLEHPNIVRVLDVGKTPNGTSFYVMERLEGRTLSQEVQNEGPLSVGQTLGHMRRLSSALSTAHRAGVVHRDLKPDNVFVVANAQSPFAGIKLLDFGVAKIVSTQGGMRAPLVPTMQSMVGSPRFMAPELVLGEAADARSDVYALGLLFHFMLRGAPPFENAKGIAEICRAQVEQELEPLDASILTQELVNVVRRATDKRRDARFQNVMELEAVLFQVEQWAALRGDLLNAKLPRPNTPNSRRIPQTVTDKEAAAESARGGAAPSSRQPSALRVSTPPWAPPVRAPFDWRVFGVAAALSLLLVGVASIGLFLWSAHRAADDNHPLPTVGTLSNAKAVSS